MGKSIVELVVDKLCAKGFRAAEACPGRIIPALTDVAVAVGLSKVELGEKMVTLEVSVIAPSRMGAQSCQEAALAVGLVLQSDGADCTQESCTFDERTNLFCSRIVARYAGTAMPADWKQRAGFSVSIGNAFLESLVSFTAWRERTEGSADYQWHFQLEEFFRPEDMEQSEPSEPFTLVVRRPLQQETYTGGKWVYQHRTTEQTGTRQIRKGIALGRTVRSYE